jgi:hypothetical protein
MGGCIAGCAHLLEKSAPTFADTSIHRLCSYIEVAVDAKLTMRPDRQ